MANTLNLGNGDWATKENSLLGYNSENGNYKPLPFDFTRASNGTFVNKSGLIETAASGVPRIDFSDSTSGALLLEPQRSNIFDYSSDLSAWSKLNSTVTESNVLSLDGVNNSYGYERTSNSSSYIYRTVSLANTTQYTLSFFVKSGTSTNVRTDIWDTTQSTQCEIQVDLETKAISNFTGTSYKIEDYTNGWMRISVTFTSESSFGTTFNRYFNADSVGSELYIWGAQLEVGSYATSLINTQGSAVTRVADACSQTPPSGIIGQTEGSIFIEIDVNSRVLSSSWAFSLNDGTTSNYIGLRRSGGAEFFVHIAASGTTTALIATGITSGKNKISIGYASNNIIVYVNGVNVGTDTSSSIPTTSDLQIGNLISNRTLEDSVSGFKLYNTRLSNAELAALTS